jgi:hypothetical protein
MSGAGGARMAMNADEFRECADAVSSVVNIRAKLPDVPFTQGGGYVALSEWCLSLGTHYLPVLAALMDEFGDDELLCVDADADPARAALEHGFWPGFRIGRDALFDHYWDALTYEGPDGLSGGGLAYASVVVGMTGSSGRWGLFADQEWNLTLIQVPVAEGPWLHLDILFLPAEEAVENFSTWPGISFPTVAQKATFVRHFADFGVTGSDQ